MSVETLSSFYTPSPSFPTSLTEDTTVSDTSSQISSRQSQERIVQFSEPSHLDRKKNDILVFWKALAARISVDPEIPENENLQAQKFDVWLNKHSEHLAIISSLYLNNLKLTHLPLQVSRLSGLTHLELSQNELTNLPDTFATLTALKTLHIGHNRFTHLPSSLTTLSLSTLYLNDNALISLLGIELITTLEELSLERNNPLTSLPSLTAFSKLRMVTLDDCHRVNSLLHPTAKTYFL